MARHIPLFEDLVDSLEQNTDKWKAMADPEADPAEGKIYSNFPIPREISDRLLAVAVAVALPLPTGNELMCMNYAKELLTCEK